MADPTPWLIDTTTGAKLAQATSEGSETTLPDGYKWTWCLDGRHEPYNELELEEVMSRARVNRKRYLLVNESQLPSPEADTESEETEESEEDEEDDNSDG
jgi:hypothetical protein